MGPTERWRLLCDGHLSGAENMARDEALLLSVEEGYGSPTVRLYGWSEKTLSLGYMQDASVFAGAGLPLVRRPTGGRAVLHWQEITYAVVAPIDREPFNRGLHYTYYVLNSIILATLKEMGVEAELSCRKKEDYRRRESCFHSASRYEVCVDGRKLSGGAQRRLKRAFLQHGSVLVSLDKEGLRRLFGKDAPRRMAALDEFVEVDRDFFLRVFAKKVEEHLGVEFTEGGLTDRELSQQMRLFNRYSSPLWTKEGKTALGV